jgi:hypothetical protein
MLAATCCAPDVLRPPAPEQSTTGVASQKASLTPAQRKISPLLLDEISRRKSDQTQKPLSSSPNALVKIDEMGRARVDIRAAVTPALLARVKELDGIVISSYREYDSTIAWIPLLKLEQLAADDAVRFIEPALDPMPKSTPPTVK